MKPIKLAIVGATGLVGRSVIQVLEEKKLPIESYGLFASSKSAGSKFSILGKDYIVEELTPNSFDSGFDFAIFSAGGEIAKIYAPIATKKGCIVIDNSSYFRMDKQVPLVVPEVNMEDAFTHHGIIANPNCSTIQAMLPLKALEDKYHIKRIVYSTYQAVSGAGKDALLDLENTDGSESLKKFPYPIYNNCLPHIDVFMENGYTKEEMKMINETKKILHRPDLKITATTVRVPVKNSHSESINVEFEEDFEMEDLRSTLKAFPNLILQDDISTNLYPLAIHANGHDEVFVGRVRRDESVKSGVNLWVVADNIRKGASSNAVQIVENLIKQLN
ncbi:MAG: aspartate-semialdehyde dehydrogenase [Clostridia bacterium]|nr:aspartate-semialdehyde dehydrogenase [Clostridia bacterium]